MIANPYKVLGVSESCTDAELKKAYRDKSKKWHPDQNPDNQEYSEKRFKEVQEAYRQIVNARERGTSPYGNAAGYGGQAYEQGRANGSTNYGYANYGAYSGFSDFFSQWQQYSKQQRSRQEAGESTEEQAARNYINNGHYREAWNALNGVPEAGRGARWYYYAAMANSGLGNNVNALAYAKRAADLEPGNQLYTSYLQQLQNGGVWYHRQNQNYGFNGFGNGNSRMCTYLCLANLLCNCCLGGHGGIYYC